MQEFRLFSDDEMAAYAAEFADTFGAALAGCGGWSGDLRWLAEEGAYG